ncbi:hypothetical protein [Actinacidiphila glaucinigra]|uniref:Uncharacterized protein n=1 Tax=Actinacidiphila glaucinigra TaxID=235986 RepID=A0A239JF74_9ACTN|nr:hypothetical protein [Actinacidiphila glaucinigra]WSD63960.1 hypothetical protein OIE69_36250 [Actinacidiphila glaucinigra]SNT04470.1 hypothetical protein SAMN05216252_1132 [Actinacidiphila glaucinigra]
MTTGSHPCTVLRAPGTDTVRVDGQRIARQSGRVQHMDDIFGEIVEEIVEETAEELGGEVAEDIVEGLFD